MRRRRCLVRAAVGGGLRVPLRRRLRPRQRSRGAPGRNRAQPLSLAASLFSSSSRCLPSWFWRRHIHLGALLPSMCAYATRHRRRRQAPRAMGRHLGSVSDGPRLALDAGGRLGQGAQAIFAGGGRHGGASPLRPSARLGRAHWSRTPCAAHSKDCEAADHLERAQVGKGTCHTRPAQGYQGVEEGET